jgi:hypothetical protein
MFTHQPGGGRSRTGQSVLAGRRLLAGFVLAFGLTPCALAAGVETGSAAAATSYLTLSNANLPPVTEGTPYSQQLDIVGGTGPYVFQLEGPYSPPSGVSVSSSGVVTASGSLSAGLWQFFVRATDQGTGERTQFDWQIILPIQPASGSLVYVTNSSLQVASGVPFSQQLQMSTGTGPYSFTFSHGVVPPGLTLSPSGLVSGTAEEQQDAPVTSLVYFNVTDEGTGQNLGSNEININVTPPDYAPPPAPTIAPTSIPEAKTGQAYSVTLTPGGGTPPYGWYVSGSLPSGFRFSNGTISGKSSYPEQSTFTVTVLDDGYSAPNSDPYQIVYMQQSTSQAYTLTVTSGVATLDPVLADVGSVVGQVDSLTSTVTDTLDQILFTVSCLPSALDTLLNGTPPSCP